MKATELTKTLVNIIAKEGDIEVWGSDWRNINGVSVKMGDDDNGRRCIVILS